MISKSIIYTFSDLVKGYNTISSGKNMSSVHENSNMFLYTYDLISAVLFIKKTWQ